MRVLLTGCAGFIAWRTAQFLLDEDHEVIGIDNLNDYYDVKLKKYRLESLNNKPKFKFYKIDIENQKKLKKLFKKYNFDVVLNLAARAGVRYSLVNPHVYMTTNADGTLNILEAMREFEIKKIVLASTSSLYAGLSMPFKENLPVNTPISPYAASKKAAEVMTYTYKKLFNIDATILRYFTVYGPAGRPDMSVFRFIKWIDEGAPITLYGDGTQSRDFTYVDDIALGTIKAINLTGYEIINLGGGKNPVSINALINKIEKILNKKAVINNQPFHDADMKETWADISKAKKIINWESKVSLDEGIENTVKWYLENKNWVKKIKV